MDEPKIISRKEARQLGLSYYFTGKPCAKGHISKRQVINCQCRKCWLEWASASAAVKAGAHRRYLEKQDQLKKYASEYAKRFRKENHEKVLQRERDYRKANIERRHEYARKWRINNPEKTRMWQKASKHNRRARERNILGSFSVVELKEILKSQQYRCAYCRLSLRDGHHLDHIISVARGGTNDRRNLQFLCEKCNLQKGARDPIEHAQSLGLLL